VNTHNLKYVLSWVIGPWIAGTLLILVSGLLRGILAARHIENEVHFHYFGAYVVASRRMCFAALVVLLVALSGLAMLLSRKIA
jgi:hypothetical protein